MRFPPVKVNGQEFLPLRFQSGRGPLHLPDLRSWFGRGSAFYQTHAPLRGFSGIRILTYTWCLRTRQVRNPGLPPRSCSFRLFTFTGYVGKLIPNRWRTSRNRLPEALVSGPRKGGALHGDLLPGLARRPLDAGGLLVPGPRTGDGRCAHPALGARAASFCRETRVL